MYCNHCGKKIPNDAVVCTKCGRQVKPLNKQKSEEKKPVNPWKTTEINLLCFGSILMPLLGYGAGIYGIIKNDGKKGQGWLLVALAVISTIFWIALLGA